MKGFMSQAGDWIAGVFLIAVLYMLIRPGSPATAAVDAITGAFNDMVHLDTQA